jgi:hypothetical protein
LFLGEQDRHCGMCHAPGTATAAKVDSIYQALKGADGAYTQAEAAIGQASAKRLIVTLQAETLQQASTPLIEAKALQHTVNVERVQAKVQESMDLGQRAQASAKALLKDVGTRYVGMFVAVVVILVVVVLLVLIKRELDQDLEAGRAPEKRGSL